jgi:hypothetical protein
MSCTKKKVVASGSYLKTSNGQVKATVKTEERETVVLAESMQSAVSTVGKIVKQNPSSNSNTSARAVARRTLITFTA